MNQLIFLWMRSCERLNGITRTTPRGSFEQTEFPNHLGCRNRRCRNLRLGQMLRRSTLIQLSQNNRTFHDSQKKQLPPGLIPFPS